METTLALLLALNVLFNIAVWPQFANRVFKDDRARDANGKATKFLTVHVVIFIVAAVVTLASIIGAIAGFTAN